MKRSELLFLSLALTACGAPIRSEVAPATPPATRELPPSPSPTIEPTLTKPPLTETPRPTETVIFDASRTPVATKDTYRGNNARIDQLIADGVFISVTHLNLNNEFNIGAEHMNGKYFKNHLTKDLVTGLWIYDATIGGTPNNLTAYIVVVRGGEARLFRTNERNYKLYLLLPEK